MTTERFITQFESGHHFGDIALLMEVKRTATVRARTFCELCVLTRDVFLLLTDEMEELQLVMEEQLLAQTFTDSGGDGTSNSASQVQNQLMKKKNLTFSQLTSAKKMARKLSAFKKSYNYDDLETVVERSCKYSGGSMSDNSVTATETCTETAADASTATASDTQKTSEVAEAEQTSTSAAEMTTTTTTSAETTTTTEATTEAAATVTTSSAAPTVVPLPAHKGLSHLTTPDTMRSTLQMAEAHAGMAPSAPVKLKLAAPVLRKPPALQAATNASPLDNNNALADIQHMLRQLLCANSSIDLRLQRLESYEDSDADDDGTNNSEGTLQSQFSNSKNVITQYVYWHC